MSSTNDESLSKMRVTQEVPRGSVRGHCEFGDVNESSVKLANSDQDPLVLEGRFLTLREILGINQELHNITQGVSIKALIPHLN